MKNLAVCVLLALLALPSAGLEPHLVKDIRTGPLDSDPSHLVTLGDAVLFIAFSEEDGTFGPDLWRSDGTAGGTWRLAERAVAPVRLTERLYFFRDLNNVLWVTDGTAGGTFPLTPPGVILDPHPFLAPNLWVPSQGVLYFVAWDAHGHELWRSDGTVAGTRLVEDVRPGPVGSGVQWLTEYRGQAWFFADDGEHGFALWRSDGTPAGTALAIDLPPLPPLTDPQPIHVVGGRLAFFAPNRQGNLQLWAGDGTARGTWPIVNLSGKKKRPAILGSDVRAGRLYFVAEDRRGQELWVSDGTGRGTRPLTAFRKPDALAVSPQNFFPLQRDGVVNGRLLFRADDGVHGIEPWITDGTPQGTRLLRDLCPGACSSFTDPWYVLDGRLYFTNQREERELWSTDGTPAGTRLVSGGFFNLYSPIVVGDRLFFVGRDAESSEEIWSTNAAGDGIVRVTGFEEPFLWERQGLDGAVLHGMLLFPATDAAHGRELWAITP